MENVALVNAFNGDEADGDSEDYIDAGRHEDRTDASGHRPGCNCESLMALENEEELREVVDLAGSEADSDEWTAMQQDNYGSARVAAAKSDSMRSWSVERIEKEIAMLRAVESWIAHHLELVDKSSPSEASASDTMEAPLPLSEAVKQAKAKVERLQLAARQHQVRVDLHYAIVAKITKDKDRLSDRAIVRQHIDSWTAKRPPAARSAVAVSALL